MARPRIPAATRVFERLRWGILLAIVAAANFGCNTAGPGPRPHADAADCYAFYDAGSSQTRLYVYEQTDRGWSMHRGPRTAALADPVRGNRGKTMADAGSTVDALVAALDDIRGDGPPNRNGVPRWLAFDWQRQCRMAGAYVLGTAGMRLAERKDAAASGEMWKLVLEKLGKRLGAPVTARTISEFEEGLYAWLALNETLAETRFGVAELGGGSLQVTFPCRGCEGTKAVKVGDRSIDIYSHSFLGWGQDEVWNLAGHVAACERGAGVADPDWQAGECEAVMQGFADASGEVAAFIRKSGVRSWYLSDAFFYMQAGDIGDYCRKGLDSGFEPESSCFRAVYQQYVLKSLALPPDAEKSAVNWTLGAVACTASRCLEAQPED